MKDKDILKTPRLSISSILMGIGVIASVVLNYAAYDTRITVLEETRITEAKLIVDLAESIVIIEKEMNNIKNQNGIILNENRNILKWIERSEKFHDKLEDRIHALEITAH